jgi:hypothetical protein
MPTWKRRAADLLESLTGARVVPPRDLPILYEQAFLKQFFGSFDTDLVF